MRYLQIYFYFFSKNCILICNFSRCFTHSGRTFHRKTFRLEVTQIKKKLNKRERLFCSGYVCTGNAETAAKQAGYKKDYRLTGERLLCEEKILAEIERLLSLRRKTFSKLAAVGYYRLAFGDVSDALRLLNNQPPTPVQPGELDLFQISEIKKPKDGALEIKFFDRLKALEQLAALGEESVGVAGLFDAIGRGAQTAERERDV